MTIRPSCVFHRGADGRSVCFYLVGGNPSEYRNNIQIILMILIYVISILYNYENDKHDDYCHGDYGISNY